MDAVAGGDEIGRPNALDTRYPCALATVLALAGRGRARTAVRAGTRVVVAVARGYPVSLAAKAIFAPSSRTLDTLAETAPRRADLSRATAGQVPRERGGADGDARSTPTVRLQTRRGTRPPDPERGRRGLR